MKGRPVQRYVTPTEERRISAQRELADNLGAEARERIVAQGRRRSQERIDAYRQEHETRSRTVPEIEIGGDQ